MIDWWHIHLSTDGPSAVIGGDGRRIVIPLRSGNSRAGRKDAIEWSAKVARGLLAQLNGPRQLKSRY